MEYQQIAAGWFFPAFSTDASFPHIVWVGVLWNGAGGGWAGFSCLAHCWVLRQQGRGGVRGLFGFAWFCPGFVCFWFPGCMVRVFVGGLRLWWRGASGVRGVWYGVVV